MTDLVLDTSLAVPLLLASHTFHSGATTWWDRREVSLAGHARYQTYAVLTRLPGDARLSPADAARLIETRFPTRVDISAATADGMIERFGRQGISGGAVYDAMVALAALDHEVVLATCDLRARNTYELVGAQVEFVR